MLRMSTAWQVPKDRVYWHPGDSISVGDCKLTAVRPPLFDIPTTSGIHDEKSEAFFLPIALVLSYLPRCRMPMRFERLICLEA